MAVMGSDTQINAVGGTGQLRATLRAPGPGHWEQRQSKRLRSVIKALPPRPVRSQLERACRIALMEGEEPAPVETIYDRIVRRGSISFLGYKRPFRAITSTMCNLAKKGEVCVVVRTANSVRRKPLWRRSFSAS